MKNPQFAQFFFIHEHFQRFLTNQSRRTGPFWYFVPLLLVGFLPWTTLLPGILVSGARREGRNTLQNHRLLLVWTVFIFLFFSKSGSKLPSYILPMFPALALLAGDYLARASTRTVARHLILPALFWLGLLLAFPFARHFVNADTPFAAVHHFAAYVACAAMFFLFCAACAWRYLMLDQKLPALFLIAMASVVAFTGAALGYDSYGQLKSSRALVAQLQPSADTQLFSVRYYDQTFPFYTRRNVTLVDYVDEFQLGEQAAPNSWIPTLDGFIVRWQAAPRALAMMAPDTFSELTQRGVAMRVVYRDTRRLVVSKP
jgi:4-amino-4-deoxy-L-arabinose transferase-like glycosyltransferase